MNGRMDSILMGLLSSLFVTAFGVVLIYVLRYMPLNYSFDQFLKDIAAGTSKTSASLSLCLLANIPLMYFNQRRRRFKAFYGISIVIILLAIVIVASKFNLFH
jgi:hypothetical protein